MCKGALFDLDGVVLDTEKEYTRFWRDIFVKYLSCDERLEKKIKGLTLEKIYEVYFPNPRIQMEISRALKFFEFNMHLEFIEGVFSFIQQLRRKKILTAVVTSSNTHKMQLIYEKYPDFKKTFDAVITAEDVVEGKPSPECYLLATQKLGLSTQECIGFEDSINGLIALKRANVKSVGLTTTHDKESIKHLAHLVIEDFSVKNIEKINMLFTKCH